MKSLNFFFFSDGTFPRGVVGGAGGGGSEPKYAAETGRPMGAAGALCTSPFPHSLSPFVVWQHRRCLT